MKEFICSFLLLTTCLSVSAQKGNQGFPISVGYFGQFAIQPGLKISTHIDVKNWDNEKSLFISPQVAFFTKIGNHNSYLLQTDIGYKRAKGTGKSYSAYSLGLGFIQKSELLSVVVNLNDGSLKEKNRDQRAYFMPSLNYEWGHRITPNLNAYSKFTAGYKMSSEQENTPTLFIELGFRFKL